MSSEGTVSPTLSRPSSGSSFRSFPEKDNVVETSSPKLRLFASPLVHGRKAAHDDEDRPASVITISGPFYNQTTYVDQLRKESTPNIYDQRTLDAPFKKTTETSVFRETPEFQRYQETTNIELFYDLFFVANLTTFTDVLDINSVEALKSYAGFFCILWFLWVQISLFDVRFVNDSILERAGKAAQFGVMIGLAVVGPSFSPTDQIKATFRTLAIILMLSRMILGLQYSVVLYHVWNYKDSKLPLTLVVGSNFAAAFSYLGTFFGFKADNPTGKVFIVWYITAALETIINITISARWDVLSFKGTHLIQRMSLLTLIIFGEGIIGLCKSCATIAQNEGQFPAGLIGVVVSAVIIIYFIYMIYFDWISRTKQGGFRQEIWAFLHFPFHLALVLLVEGAAQFIIWRKVVEVVAGINSEFTQASRAFKGNNSGELANLLSDVTNKVLNQFNPKFTHTITDAQNAIDGVGNSTFDSAEQISNITTLFRVIQSSIFANFEIEPPEHESAVNVPVEPNDEWNKNMDAFMLVFVYFFVAAGFTLIMMNILNAIIRPKTTWKDNIRITINWAIGVGLASLAALSTTQAGFNFAQSAYVLPTVAVAFVLVFTIEYAHLLR